MNYFGNSELDNALSALAETQIERDALQAELAGVNRLAQDSLHIIAENDKELSALRELLSSVPVEAIKRGMLEMQIEHRRLQAQVNYLNNPTITMQQNEGSLADMLIKLEAFLAKLAAHKGDKA